MTKLLTLSDGMTMRLDTVITVSPVHWTKVSAYIGWRDRSPFYVVSFAQGEPVKIWHDTPEKDESSQHAPLSRVLAREAFITAWEQAIANSTPEATGRDYASDNPAPDLPPSPGDAG